MMQRAKLENSTNNSWFSKAANSNTNAPIWKVSVISGPNQGANAQITNKTLSVGDDFGDEIVLDSPVGASRIVLSAANNNGAKIQVNGEAVSINDKPIFEGLDSFVNFPVVANLGDTVVRIEILNGKKIGSEKNIWKFVWGALIVSAILFLGSLFYFKILPNLKTAYFNEQKNVSVDNGATLATSPLKKGDLDIVKSDIQSMGLQNSISIFEEDGKIVAMGRVSKDEAGAWSDLKNSLGQKLATPIVDKVEEEKAEKQEELAKPKVTMPAIGNNIAAIDFAGAKVVFKNGSIVNMGDVAPNGWRLDGVFESRLVFSNDGAQAIINIDELQ